MVGLQRQHEGGCADGQGTDEGELDGDKGIGEAGEQIDEGQKQGHDVLHQIQRRRPLDIVDDPPPLLHHLGHGGEVGVQQHHLGHLAGRLRPGGHGDAAVRVLQGQHVVDAVPRHGHGMARLLQRLHQLALLVRGHPAEHGVIPHRPGVVAGLLQGGGVHKALRPFDPRLHGHGGHGGGVVPRDHLHLHPLLGKIAEGVRGLRPDGVADDRQGQRLHRPRDPPLHGGGGGAFRQ